MFLECCFVKDALSYPWHVVYELPWLCFVLLDVATGESKWSSLAASPEIGKEWVLPTAADAPTGRPRFSGRYA